MNLSRHLHLPIFIGLTSFFCTILALLMLALARSPQTLTAAMNLGGTTQIPPTSTTSPRITITITPSETPSSTPTLKPTRRLTKKPPTASPTPTRSTGESLTRPNAPTRVPLMAIQHLSLGRPLPLGAMNSSADPTYLYGSSQYGALAIHHGEDLVTPLGTPILAVADGQVIVAGDDSQPRCGDKGDRLCGFSTDFYGKLIVIQLEGQYQGQRVFALYGHLSRVNVQVGQHVHAGDNLGNVGESGIARGPHLHLEIREGVNDYAHTRNPLLWLKPLAGTGVLAGRVMDRKGNPVTGATVTLYSDDGTNTYIQDTTTYDRDDDDTPLVNADDNVGENFAMDDLDAGKYYVRVQVGGLNYGKHLVVQDSRLTVVTIQTK